MKIARKTMSEIIDSNRQPKSETQISEGGASDSAPDNPGQGHRSIYARDHQENNPDHYDLPHPLARQWLAARHGTRWCDRTVSTYRSSVQFYAELLDDLEIALLDASFGDFERFIESRVRHGLSKSTINTDRAAIKNMYQFLETRTDAEPRIDLQKFDELDISQYNYSSGFERDSLSIKEVELLFKNFENTRNKLMTYFGVVTGVRNSDIRSLQFKHIDESEEEIVIPDPKNSKPYAVAMSKELARKLIEWENVGRKSYSPSPDNDYVFPSEQGGKLEKNYSFNRYIRKAAESAGIQEVIGRVPLTGNQRGSDTHRNMYRVTAHTLRHTFVTLLKDGGASDETRRLAANHESIDTTRQYEHSDEEWHDLVRSILSDSISD